MPASAGRRDDMLKVGGLWVSPVEVEHTILTHPHVAECAVVGAADEDRLIKPRAFVGVQDVVARVREQSVAIPMPMPPTVESRNDFSEVDGTAPQVAALGVFVSPTHVLTHSAALDGRSSFELSLGNDLTTQGRVVAYEPSTGLVLLQTEITGRLPPILATEAPAAGALAVGVGRSNGLDLAVPVFVTSVGGGRYTIGAVNGAVLPGMPVFNLAGELLAVAVPHGQQMRAIPVRDAADRLIAALDGKSDVSGSQRRDHAHELLVRASTAPPAN